MRETHADPFLRRLMLLLTVLIVLGAVGTAAAVIGAQQTRAASKADVTRNADLIRQLGTLQREADENHAEHRQRNEQIHADICRLLAEVVNAAPSLRDQGITPCAPPLDPEDLTPFPSPTPSS